MSDKIELGLHESLPAAQYHAATWAVSNSMRKVFSIDGPAHLKNKLAGIPEDDSGLDDDERMARVMGNLLHIATLEPELFKEGKNHHTKPRTYTDAKGEVKPFNGNANACKDWLAMHDDLPVISEKDGARITGARDAILAHPVAGPLVKARGVHEASIFAKHPETGLLLRMRADILTEDAEGRAWAADIKSCPSVTKFVRSAREFQYPQQQAVYELVMKLHGIDNPAFAFIACELKPKYGIHAVRVISFDDETMQQAREAVENDLRRYAECVASGIWPLTYQEHELISAKKWS